MLETLPLRCAPFSGRSHTPKWVSPTPATLTDRRFSDPAWIFEPKLDGERFLAFRHGPQVRLLSRNQLRMRFLGLRDDKDPREVVRES